MIYLVMLTLLGLSFILGGITALSGLEGWIVSGKPITIRNKKYVCKEVQ